MARDNREPLPWVLARHLDRMSRRMMETDGHCDLSRETTFYVNVGYDQYLAKDPDFPKLWAQYLQNLARGPAAAPHGVVYQTWRYFQDLRVIRKASGIYGREGLLMHKGMSWDTEEVQDRVEVEA